MSFMDGTDQDQAARNLQYNLYSVNLLPNAPKIQEPLGKSPLKTLLEKEKMLVTSIFSFSTMFSTL